MRKIDRWREWTGGLGDSERAELWLGLGVLAALPEVEARSPTDASTLLSRAVRRRVDRDQRVPWVPPSTGRFMDAVLPHDVHTWLSWIQGALKSLDLASRDAGDGQRPPLRLVMARRQARKIAGEYEKLLRSGPWDLAISYNLRAKTHRRLDWPLRIGYTDDRAPAALTSAAGHWSTSKLTRLIPVARGSTHCDVLWFDGTLELFQAHLGRTTLEVKAAILVVQLDPDQPVIQRHRSQVASLLGAGAVVGLLQQHLPDELGDRFNSFVKHFSHDLSLDAALALAFHDVARVWVSESAAQARISLNAAAMSRQLQQVQRSEAPPLVSRPADVISLALTQRLDTLTYNRESDGASELAEAALAIAQAEAAAADRELPADRFLHMDAFVGRDRRPAHGGFEVGTSCLIVVDITADTPARQRLDRPFKLNGRQVADAELTVWLTEPQQLRHPMKGTLTLPPEGPSDRCEFEFRPSEAGRFDGRVSVLHRGRVVQTARILADVRPRGAEPTQAGGPVLSNAQNVRSRLSDLQERRPFDLSFVTNHAAAGEPRVVGLAQNSAWIQSLAPSARIIQEINVMMSEMAKDVASYDQGLDSAAGLKFIIQLARLGSQLRDDLVGENLARQNHGMRMAGEEYIQVVSAQSDSVVPFEFIYEYNAPAPGASLCEHWRDAMEKGRCFDACAISKDPDHKAHVCPMGFWGQQKVIERHQLSLEHGAAGRPVYLQSEPRSHADVIAIAGHVLVAHSERVKPPSRHTVGQALLAFTSFVTHSPVESWDEWESAVKTWNPSLLVSMPHTEASEDELTLEISGIALDTVDIQRTHVTPRNSRISPIVVLLGCDTAESLHQYSRAVMKFRARGAAIIVGTIATVAVESAPNVAKAFLNSILMRYGETIFLGEAIRSMRRKALLDNQLVPLCMVAYGDADWRLQIGAPP